MIRLKLPKPISTPLTGNNLMDILDADQRRVGEKAGSIPRKITMDVCGGTQARVCRVTGTEHDMSAVVQFKDGGSVACKDCGVTAMSLDLMELP